jgi:histidine triad (HIT) family protein
MISANALQRIRMKGCVFCQIANGSIETHPIYRDELIVAFPDSHPIRPGHAMIISHQHWPYFEDLSEATACRIALFAQRLAAVMKELFSVPRVAFAFTGGDHDHAHAHVIPMHEKNGSHISALHC